MATYEQEQAKLQELNTSLEALNDIEPESLVRAEDLGKDLSFEAGLPVFRRILNLFHDLSESNLDNVPHETLNRFQDQAKQALALFNDQEFLHSAESTESRSSS